VSTNSIVGIATDTGFKGRYVHWDGYPSGVGQAVADIVKRDGMELAVKTLTEDHVEWSTLTAEAEPSGHGSDHSVAGYGVAYGTQDQQDAWLDETSQPGPEWAYVITEIEILVWRFLDGVWKRSVSDDIII
jgi:hypothetical protein